jgi:hypothetical protein
MGLLAKFLRNGNEKEGGCVTCNSNTKNCDARKTNHSAKPNLSHLRPSDATPMNVMDEVDVVSKLEEMAKKNPQKLDWKVSIVDLLKLLEIDSSLEARKELAVELGCPADKIGGDYAEMNVWLHKTVLKKIALNGGNIPKDLLD